VRNCPCPAGPTLYFGDMDRRLAHAVVVALGLVLVATAPASGASGTVRDQVGDQRGGARFDLRKVGVTHGHHRVKIVVDTRAAGPDGVDIFVDTRKGRRGPEFLIAWEGDLSDVVHIYPTSSWTAHGREKRCLGARSRWGTGNNPTFSVPRSCLANKGRAPRALRVNVETVDFRYQRFADAAVAPHRWDAKWIHSS
jgi:hypothetical protein